MALEVVISRNDLPKKMFNPSQQQCANFLAHPIHRTFYKDIHIYTHSYIVCMCINLHKTRASGKLENMWSADNGVHSNAR